MHKQDGSKYQSVVVLTRPLEFVLFISCVIHFSHCLSGLYQSARALGFYSKIFNSLKWNTPPSLLGKFITF